MDKLKAIIVDDEKHCRISLAKMLEWYCPSVELMQSCDGVDAATEAILKRNPDVVFLDVEMPAKNGFDLLKNFETINFDIIFTTAYDEFAFDAFKVNAIDYLLKPIEKTELKSAVEKITTKKKLDFNQAALLEMYEMMRANKQYNRVAIPTSAGVEFVDPNSIIRCQAEGNYSKIFILEGQEIFISKTLKQLESIINVEYFIRPHASHYVNMNFVKKYHKGVGGQLELDDGTRIPVSRHRKDGLNLK